MLSNRPAKLFAAIAVAACVAVIAVPSALASPARTASGTACQTEGTHWITVTDDQGVPWLAPVDSNICTTAIGCDATAEAASPYPGWVSITDDDGVPWLYPALQNRSTTSTTCAPSADAPAVGTALTSAESVTTPDPILRSPYPGWIVVVDDQGVPWLEPVSR
jgi:hypothetical protein